MKTLKAWIEAAFYATTVGRFMLAMQLATAVALSRTDRESVKP